VVASVHALLFEIIRSCACRSASPRKIRPLPVVGLNILGAAPVLLISIPVANVEPTEVEFELNEFACNPPVNVEVELLCTVRKPVVVAPPLIVRPPACKPLPIVEEAEESRPLKKYESPVDVAERKSSVAKCEVEEAKIPCWAKSTDVVAEVVVP